MKGTIETNDQMATPRHAHLTWPFCKYMHLTAAGVLIATMLWFVAGIIVLLTPTQPGIDGLQMSMSVLDFLPTWIPLFVGCAVSVCSALYVREGLRHAGLGLRAWITGLLVCNLCMTITGTLLPHVIVSLDLETSSLIGVGLCAFFFILPLLCNLVFSAILGIRLLGKTTGRLHTLALTYAVSSVVVLLSTGIGIMLLLGDSTDTKLVIAIILLAAAALFFYLPAAVAAFCFSSPEEGEKPNRIARSWSWVSAGVVSVALVLGLYGQFFMEKVPFTDESMSDDLEEIPIDEFIEEESDFSTGDEGAFDSTMIEEPAEVTAEEDFVN